ncbi:MAG: hypothetical protein ABI699_12435 [Caldimonas sp.]
MNCRTTLSFRGATAIAASAALALAACGGGGDSAAPPIVPATLVLTGTAATGVAIASGTIEARCAAGNGGTTTAVDGSFTVTITGGALPCVLRVTAGATVLHSLATGSGASARANITPATELVVARLGGIVPATYYASFDRNAVVGLTAAAATAASSAVVESLRAGVDFSGVANLLGGALVAANGSVAGDAYDQRLDALKARLATASITLAELAQSIAFAAPAGLPALRSSAASLPPELLLAAAAANCASLRSGRYRVVVNEDGGTAASTEVVVFDAATLTVVGSGGTPNQLVATGPCTYTNPAGGEVAVSRAGVVISRVGGNAGLVGAVFFPEQAHALTELTGDYNALAFDRTSTNGPIHLTSSTFGLDLAGKVSALNFCDDLRTCVASTVATLPDLRLSPNAGGGFDLTNTTAGYVDRAFAYRAGGGELMLVLLAKAGHITFATANLPVNLPAVGRVQTFWNMFIGAQYTAAAALNLSRNTVVSADAANGSFVRAAVQNFATNATRPETVKINSLRAGYNQRLPANGVLHSDGGMSNVLEFIALTMRGMDLSVLVLPASNQMGFSVLQ